MDKTNNDKLVTVVPNDIAEYDFDTIIAAAERSKIIFDALNTIMQNALKITTHYDWVLIGGKPYLQESGATKVARMFGISWRILDVTKEMDEGYPSFTYRMEFKMGRSTIECDGARSGKDEFFAGARDKRKSADFVDANDVKKAAYTNCLNNGIKRLVPGLRNIDIEALEKAGIDTKKISGYTFKEGSQGGKGKAAENSGLVCEECEAVITQAEASYSQAKYNAQLCRACQKKAASAQKEAVKNNGKEASATGKSAKNGNTAKDSALACEECGVAITKAEAEYSDKKFGMQLCRACQQEVAYERAADQ